MLLLDRHPTHDSRRHHDDGQQVSSPHITMTGRRQTLLRRSSLYPLPRKTRPNRTLRQYLIYRPVEQPEPDSQATAGLPTDVSTVKTNVSLLSGRVVFRGIWQFCRLYTQLTIRVLPTFGPCLGRPVGRLVVCLIQTIGLTRPPYTRASSLSHIVSFFLLSGMVFLCLQPF